MYYMQNQYSIAIYPPLPIIEEVEGIKNELAAIIGWFNSKNSKGHITIGNFYADIKEVSKIKSALTTQCSSEPGLKLNFNHFESYPNGTFCILPDAGCRDSLKDLMKRIQQCITIKGSYKSTNPHITIGRKLDEDKLAIASKLFTKVGMNFYCDRIVLRMLDDKIKQYVVVDEFIFRNQPVPSIEQIKLF